MFLVDTYKNELILINYYKNIIDTIINKIDRTPHIINNVNNIINLSYDKFIKNFLEKKLKENLEINLESDKYSNFQHLIIYGHYNTAKELIVEKLLEKIYGKYITELKDIEYNINGYSNVKTKIIIKQSKIHIVIEPNSNGLDKYLIQDIIQEYAKSELLNITSRKELYKIIVINKIDDLSYYAQASLRRTMEKYSDTCKFILISDQLSRIIEPIRSRCIMYRIPLPSNIDILEILLLIINKENIKISPLKLNEIINKSNNVINLAIWYLEVYKYNIFYDINWTTTIDEIIDLIIKKKINTNKELYKILRKIKEKFYQLFITNIPYQLIIKNIMIKLLQITSDINIKYSIIEITSFFEQRLNEGTRYIIHMEAYIIKIIELFSQMGFNI
jgi:replication factor C subunit 3/5